MSKKVAIVTGSNKGIGFSIVKRLCSEFDGDVFLTGIFILNSKKFNKVEKIIFNI
jgi:NAD(P)-dependent dehydrogenase (short-subunit alcohol dehydrogenase family)